MAKKKRSAARSAAAAVDSDASKKQKPEVHRISFEVIWPRDTSPQLAKLDVQNESIRAARTAEAEATSEEAYGRHDFGKFAKRFEAAVASAFAEEDGPVTLKAVFIKMTKATGKVKIGKDQKERFVWDGFNEGRWVISRYIRGDGQVAYPKGTRPKFKDWRFSPSPAAR